jgi:hypothetical protein
LKDRNPLYFPIINHQSEIGNSEVVMLLETAYRGRSAVRQTEVGLAVSLAPNLRRDRVSFVGTLRHPLRFREAVSALHDVVISDLRYAPRDKTAYEAYKAERARREGEEARRGGGCELTDAVLVRPDQPGSLVWGKILDAERRREGDHRNVDLVAVEER